MAKFPKHIIKLPSKFSSYDDYANSDDVVLPHIIAVENTDNVMHYDIHFGYIQKPIIPAEPDEPIEPDPYISY
jgi:hypothetical protein